MTDFDRNRAMSAFAQELVANQPQDDEVATISFDDNDECCEKAREQYFEFLDTAINNDLELDSKGRDALREAVREPFNPAMRDCESFRQHLEKQRNNPRQNFRIRQILDEWDACADAKISSNSNVLFDKAWNVVKGAEDWFDEDGVPNNPSEPTAIELGLEYPIVHVEISPPGNLIGFQCGDIWNTGPMFGGVKGNATFINEVGQKHLARCENCQRARHNPRTIHPDVQEENQ
jgi:hypothetical protein